MRSLFNSLRVLIAAGSVAGFVGAWALLAHSGKPVSAAAPQPIINNFSPAPLRPQDLPGVQVQPLQQLRPLTSLGSFTAPRLRTGGS